MKKICWFGITLFLIVGCSTLENLFRRHNDVVPPAAEAKKVEPETRRTTRRSLEEESMLNEQSGSLWINRGQSSFLFANNNQRLLGDMLEIKLEGYPKEQVQTKVNVIAKLLSEILNEQKQEIKLKQEELKKQMTPEYKQEQQEQKTESRGLASMFGVGDDEEEKPEGPTPEQQMKDQEKSLKRIDEEEGDIKGLTKNKDFPIRTVATRIVEIQKDGNYRVRGEQPFMIGKREYKLLVAGTVRSEEYNEKGMSAEALLDPVFDIISDKKGEAL
ncbi:flagellar basal body L-ring protein FlgH [bacterium]|nr:flagellar basal body L-ring protein FlgH [bacterium]